MRILGLFLCAGLLMPAQSGPEAPKAPAEVDKALRSRVEIFFQAHVDGKPRVADQVVAEDSKDFFFEIPKPRYFSFEILKTEYSDEFTKATVTVNCEEEVMMMGLGKMKVKMPRTSTWKLENGQWYWYFDQKAQRETPFGKMTNAGIRAEGAPGKLQLPEGPKPQELTGHVRADKTTVTLASAPASDSVKIKNGMRGWIKLVLGRPPSAVPGLTLTLDQENVRAGEAATLSIHYDPKGEKPPAEFVNVDVRVEPTGELIPIRIVFPSEPQAAPGAPAAGAAVQGN
ncbi:MAG: hypothetical protein ACM3S5_14500 [Rhodospirillales bacterium]